MATILEDFLVRLGFNVDKNSQKKFEANLKSVQASMKKIGKVGLAIGTAVATGVVTASKSIGNMYNEANKIGTNITGIKALSQAFESVGGSANMATSAMRKIAENLHADKIEAYGASVRDALNIDIFDKNGRLKDTSKLFEEMVRQLKRMPEEEARVKAGLLGIGDGFDYFMKQGFTEEIQKTRAANAMFGDSLDANAKKAQNMSNSLSRVWENIKTATQVGAVDLIDSLGLDKWVEDFGNKLTRWIPSAFSTLKQGLSWFSKGETSVKKEATKYAERRVMDNALETDLSEEDDTPEVREALANVKEKRDNTKVLHERMAETFVAEDDKRFKIQEKALGKGKVSPTFEKKPDEVKTIEKTVEQKAIEKTVEKNNIENTTERVIEKIQSTEKPKERKQNPVQNTKQIVEHRIDSLFENNDTESQKHPVINVSYKPPIEKQEQREDYVSKPTAQNVAENLRDASSTPVTNNINRSTNNSTQKNSTQNVTINQTVTVNGTQNPEEFAKRMMKQASNTSRNLSSNIQ